MKTGIMMQKEEHEITGWFMAVCGHWRSLEI